MSDVDTTAENTEVAPEVVPEVAPVAGPEIIYLSEAAKQVVFTINPLASRYTVNENGMVSEDLA